MATAKSPFKVYQRFMSPKLCEHFCDKIGFTDADYDVAEKKPLRMVKFEDELQTAVYDRFINKIPELEIYYGFQYNGTEQMMAEWYSQDVVGLPLCENSNYLRRKWVRTRERDFAGVLFMSEYQEQTPFDSDYEVYGGKLEFPQHNFGFNPERGTLIIYPAGPHFINATAKINAGELYQVRFHFAGKTPYLYDPSKFPGDYRSWFSNL